MALLARLLLLAALLLAALPARAASTCVVVPFKIPNNANEYFLATIVETGARDTTEVKCSGVPPIATVLTIKATLTAGTGTTINPIMSAATPVATASQGHILTAENTAAHIHEQGWNTNPYPLGAFWWRSRPNSSATDHTITAFVVLMGGSP